MTRSTTRFFCSLLLTLALGCGDDDIALDGGLTDGGSTDGGLTDGGLTDGGLTDGGLADGGTGLDAGTDDDGGTTDDAGVVTDGGPAACHDLAFGATEVPLRRVTNLPMMTGGAIPEGIYDAVDFQTTMTIMGAYRGSWRVTPSGDGAGAMDVIQQLTLAAPGPITPRRYDFTTAGSTLSRVESCPDEGSMQTFAYSVEVEGETTRLLIRNGAILFVYERR